MPTSPVEYQVIDPGDGTYMVVRFDSQFRNQWTTWRARIESLSAAGGSYIEVDAASDGLERALKVGLPVNRIDQGTVIKTIIMIRQFKNLAPGRHEFGRNL